MRINTQTRIFVSLLLTFCLLILPATALAKKGEKNFKQGMRYEAGPAMGKSRPGVYARGRCRSFECGVPTPFSPRELQCFAGLHAAGPRAGGAARFRRGL